MNPETKPKLTLAQILARQSVRIRALAELVDVLLRKTAKLDADHTETREGMMALAKAVGQEARATQERVTALEKVHADDKVDGEAFARAVATDIADVQERVTQLECAGVGAVSRAEQLLLELAERVEKLSNRIALHGSCCVPGTRSIQ